MHIWKVITFTLMIFQNKKSGDAILRPPTDISPLEGMDRFHRSSFGELLLAYYERLPLNFYYGQFLSLLV